MDIRHEQVPRPHSDYLWLPRGTIEVDQGMWTAGKGEMLAPDVSSCIVLAAYNDSTGCGLLGHFSAVSPESRMNPYLWREKSDTRILHDALGVLPYLGSARDTAIWLGGASLSSQGRVNDSIMADRQYALDQLYEAITQTGMTEEDVVTQWSSKDETIAVTLNCMNGVLLVQSVAEERYPDT